MRARATRWAERLRRLRHPPVGFRHGRQARLAHQFPMVRWFYYWVTAHTTPRLYLVGVFGAGPTALLLVAGFESAAMQAGFALVAWLAACMGVGLALRPRVRAEAALPPRVASGSRFEIRYTVRNEGRWPARDVAVDTLIYSDWTSLRLRPARVGELAPGETARLSGSGLALARGVYTLPALRADSGFPGGFWRWGRTMRDARALVVYPDYARLETFDIPLGQRHRQDLSAARDLAREALEFHGCREYREGDVLRHVHPRSSARVGVPVVKEFQAEGRSRTALLVDTWERGGPAALAARLSRADPAEAALALAAAVADALSVTDRVLELLVAGPGVYRFRSEGRVGYLEEVLDILAAVEPSREDPVERLAPLLLDEIRAVQSVCLLLTGWDARRARLLEALAAWEVGVKAVLLTRAGARPAGVPDGVRCLSARAVLRGEVRSL